MRDFDQHSGGLGERIIFNHRTAVLVVFVLATLVLGWFALQLPINASFDRLMPSRSPYIQNYKAHRAEVAGLGSTIRIVVENKHGDIYDARYLEVLRQASDALYLIPGTDRSWMKSLWMPIVRWRQVTEAGVEGGAVMPQDYSGDLESIARLKANIARAGIAGHLVGNDQKSSMIVAPLLDRHPETGEPLDYGQFSRELEAKIRTLNSAQIDIRIVGFGKLVGDLIAGVRQMAMYFGLTAALAGFFVFVFTGCVRSTLLLVTVSIAAVIWLLGLMRLLGFELDPYAILVPFLIFAIGLSHGAQKMNGVLQDVGRGTHPYVAARYAFRRLFAAALTALLANLLGFATLAMIDIPVIRDMAFTTCLGVCLLGFTKLMVIPVVLSFTGVSPVAARRSLAAGRDGTAGSWIAAPVWRMLGHLTERRAAACVLAAALLLTLAATLVMRDLRIGDIGQGAPELKRDAAYNLDHAYISQHYQASGDPFIVLMKTEVEGCRFYHSLQLMDSLAWTLRQIAGVQATTSLAETTRAMTAAMAEGNSKWLTISRDQAITDAAVSSAMATTPGLSSQNCALSPLIAHLSDHQADTLSRVLAASKAFAAQNNSDAGTAQPTQFLLAAGSAGIEAATNVEIERAVWTIHLAAYAGNALLCLFAFRSWRATFVALIPLVVTTFMCKALMVVLDIGLKVATLPVIAVGVGVGVDFAIYLLSIQLAAQARGATLRTAYGISLDLTGRVVALMGMAMAAGVIGWVWSPIKFQADMGTLLAFMFLWNMVNALVLIPALSHFLLNSKDDLSS